MEVSLAFGLIDSPIGGRTNAQWCADMGIPQAKSIAEVVEACDAIVVLSPGQLRNARTALPASTALGQARVCG